MYREKSKMNKKLVSVRHSPNPLLCDHIIALLRCMCIPLISKINFKLTAYELEGVDCTVVVFCISQNPKIFLV